MWAFLSSLIEAIPAAATSEPGLIAFAITAAVYIATVWRVSRNKQILANLQKLPAEDRLAALELEMGGVRLDRGINPEHWIRSRIHRYYFLAFLITIMLVAFLGSMLFVYRSGSADITVDLKQSNLGSSGARRAFNLLASPAYSRGLGDGSDDDKTLRYVYSKNGNRISITPELKYLDSQRRGIPVTGFLGAEPFDWDFPSLSVKVVNNSHRDLVLSEVVFRVKTSVKDDRPVFVVVGLSYFGRVTIINEGWGGIASPSLQVSIKSPDFSKKSPDICSKFDLSNAEKIPLSAYAAGDRRALTDSEPNTVDESGNVHVSIRNLVSDDLIDRIKRCSDKIRGICASNGSCKYDSRELSNAKCVETRPRDECVSVNPVPSNEFISRFKEEASRSSKNTNLDIFFKRECSETRVCVHGRLDYVDKNGHPGLLNFSTISVLEAPGPSAPLLPSFSYHVFLEAGKSGYTQRLSISQQIKPGEGDNFSLRLATDRSAAFDFDMDILTVNGSVAWTGSFSVALFVPRSGAQRAKQDVTFGTMKH
jgi:hypothetical protein